MEKAGLVCPATRKSVYKCIATLCSTVETQRHLKPTKLSTELLKRIINEKFLVTEQNNNLLEDSVGVFEL